MHYFTEFRIHKNTTSDITTVVSVLKDGLYRCMNIDDVYSLMYNLNYLDGDIHTGWLIDDDVGDAIETYTMQSHPEYFV